MNFGGDAELEVLDAVGQADLVRRRVTSPLELVDAAIARIERMDGALNAVIHERFGLARREAADCPRSAAFAGVPILLKGIGAGIAGEADHSGSRALLELGRTFTADSAIVTRLRSAGFVILGRTNVPEFGLVSETQNDAFGVTRNPWNHAKSPNGSSGGSAAAVAAGMVPIAHANDGGGSIRMPASDCGLVGLKPTRGRVSHAPHEGEPMFAHVVSGVLTRTVRDTAAVMDILAGYEPGDPTIPPSYGSLTSALTRRKRSLRIGLVNQPDSRKWRTHPECMRTVEDAGRALEQLGHRVDAAYPLALFEAEYWDRWFDALSPGIANVVEAVAAERGTDPEDDFDPVTLLWARRGAAMRAVQLAAAIDWLDAFRRRVVQWWEAKHDILLTPVGLTPPQPIGSTWATPEAIADSVDSLQFCPQFNTTGQPAISIPFNWTADGPIGIQLVAHLGREDLLVGLAAELEEARPWAARYPARADYRVDAL